MSQQQVDGATMRHFNRIKAAARSAYEEARSTIDTHKTPAMQVGNLGRGYVVEGSISSFVRRASEKTTGKTPDQSTIEYTRKFLRLSHNMVSFERVDTYVFKIFVREHWNEYDAVLPMVYQRSDQSEDWYERRLTPEEAGETRAPNEVEVKQAPYRCDHCPAGFESQHLLDRHIRSDHRGEEEKAMPKGEHLNKPVTCKKCGKKLPSVAALGGHAAHHHPKDNLQTSVKGKRALGVPIPDLSWKSSDQWSSAHGKYYCRVPDCEFTSDTVVGLSRHKEHHVNEFARDVMEAAKSEKGHEPEPVQASQMSDDDLLSEIKQRFQESRATPAEVKELETLRTRHEFIRSTVKDVNNGEIAPLKALSDIEAALDL